MTANNLEGKASDMHSCSYYCDRPECVKAQRDQLREAYVARQSEGMVLGMEVIHNPTLPPDSFVLVPREPTDEMIAAGRDELGAYVEDTDEDYRRIYRRFITAAPADAGEVGK